MFTKCHNYFCVRITLSVILAIVINHFLPIQVTDTAYAIGNTPGSLDTTFDSDGLVTAEVSLYGDQGWSVVIQPDGKIVTGGWSHSGSSFDFMLTRYNNDGSLDTTFDSDGKVTTDFGNQQDYARAAVLQADGKIVLAGYSEFNMGSESEFALARYNSDGSLDTSFDFDGKVTTNLGSNYDFLGAMALQTDGKIIVAGSKNIDINDNDIAVVRYNINGSVDTSFDSDGIVTTDFDGGDEAGVSVVVQPDGKILVGGTTIDGFASPTRTDFALIRYNGNGSLDTSFDVDGIVTKDFGIGDGYERGGQVALQPDDKILIAGSNDGYFLLARYNSNGTPDTSFDTDGFLATNLNCGSFVAVQDIALQTNGKIILAGHTCGTGGLVHYNFALARYNSDGSLDIGFDTDGKVNTDFGSNQDDFGNAVTIQADDKIVVAGYSNNHLALARYIGDGTAQVRHVKWNATGANDGTSWTNAYTDLQSALSAAASGDQIWVAAGTYKPTSGADRTISFTLKNGVAVYGGFAGTETALSQRNSVTNMTVLSGDIGVAGTADNSFHVVSGGGTLATSLLDGFTIKDGNANGAYPNNVGAGLYSSNSNPILKNLTFSSNSAEQGGGLACISWGTISITNSFFFSNNATSGFGQGGAIFNNGCGLTIVASTFSTNNALIGGAILADGLMLQVINSTFYANNAPSGGAIYNSEELYILNSTFSSNNSTNGALRNGLGGQVALHNTILANTLGGVDCSTSDGGTIMQSNHNLIETNGTDLNSCGTPFLTSDPILGSLADNGGFTQTMALGAGSPAIDAGDDAYCPDTDQRGVARPQGSYCDIGAYELEGHGPLPSPWVGGVSITSDKNVVAVGRPHIGSEVASYDGFSAGSLTAYVPMLFKTAFGSYDSALYIQNVHATNTATVTIKYYNDSGILNCTKTDTIAALSSKGYWVPAATCDTGSLPAGWVGGVVVTSNQPIVAVGRPHVDGEVMTYNGFSTGSLSTYIPMLFKGAFGGSYNAAFYVQNTHASNTANLTIKYYNDSGVLNCTKTDTLSPLASKGYWVPSATCDSGSLPAGWVGGVLVTSDQPIVAVGRPHIGTQVTTYTGFSMGSLSSSVPMLFKGAFGGSYDAAFYIQNTHVSNTANVTIKYYNDSGVLNCTKTDTIAALASKGYWVPAATCDSGSLPAGWVGGVVVTSDQPIVAVGRPHIGTQVTTYNGFPTGSLNAYLPMLFKGAFGSYNAAFYVQNTEATTASVTLKFYDTSGILTCTRNDTIPALATLGYWVPSVTCIP